MEDLEEPRVEQWAKRYRPERPTGRLREALGMSQENFAKVLKLNKNQPSRWESGAETPGGASVRKMFKLWPMQLRELGISPLDLLENSPREAQESP